MTSQKQIDANRRNAEHSTGPRTDEGKARSSQNAFSHGVLSENAISEYEDREVYQALLDRLIDELDAQTALEIVFVERLANLFWRERRLSEAEEKYLSQKFGSAREMSMITIMDRYLPLADQFLIGRYQSMLGRQVRDTLRDLREEQERRLKTIDQVNLVQPDEDG